MNGKKNEEKGYIANLRILGIHNRSKNTKRPKNHRLIQIPKKQEFNVENLKYMDTKGSMTLLSPL